jgi:hypothetical protein
MRSMQPDRRLMLHLNSMRTLLIGFFLSLSLFITSIGIPQVASAIECQTGVSCTLSGGRETCVANEETCQALQCGSGYACTIRGSTTCVENQATCQALLEAGSENTSHPSSSDAEEEQEEDPFNYDDPFGTQTSSGGSGEGVLQNPLNADSIEGLLVVVLDAVVYLGSIFLVLMLVYVGFLFVRAQGKPPELQKAREALLWTVVGGLLLLGAEGISLVIKSTVESL